MIKDIISKNETAKPNDKEMALLHEHFPQCFDKEGRFDLEKFRSSLSGKIDFTSEGYELNFLGKSYAKLLASLDTETVIQPDLDHNNKPENTKSENVYICGDNLDALKHLLKSYSGMVKCIYIDPPYNTGSDGFVYNDKFTFTAEQLVERLSISDEEAEKIIDLTNRNSASHSAWLTFMFPRLLLAKDLLADDGVIFISIDDNEQADLKLLCDNVFGEENFIANIVWQKRTSPDARCNLGAAHDYILSYCRNKDRIELALNKTELSESRKKEYSNPDEDPRGPWASVDITGQVGHATQKQFYTITTPSGKKLAPPSGRCWALTESTFNELVADNRIWFGNDGASRPRRKNFLSETEGMNAWTWWTNSEVGHNQEGTKELKELMGNDVFTNPKPIRLINKILSLATREDSIIVDFFSGSATTAHTVFLKNCKDNGHRKFIMIQLPEDLNKSLRKASAGTKSTIKNAISLLDEIGKPRTLDQIGMERIRRAANKIRQENPLFHGDLGFKHYTLQEPSTNQLYAIEDFNPNETLDAFGSSILESFGRDTVLTTWLIRDRQGFHAEVKEVKLADYTAYWCNHYLYLIDSGFSEDAAKALVEEYGLNMDFNPENVIVFGYSLGFSEMERLKYSLQVLRNTEKSLNFNLNVRY